MYKTKPRQQRISSRVEELECRIDHNQRRLRILYETKAKYGLDTRAQIITEIEDIEAEIETLQTELDDLKSSFSNLIEKLTHLFPIVKMVSVTSGLVIFVVAILFFVLNTDLLTQLSSVTSFIAQPGAPPTPDAIVTPTHTPIPTAIPTSTPASIALPTKTPTRTATPTQTPTPTATPANPCTIKTLDEIIKTSGILTPGRSQGCSFNIWTDTATITLLFEPEVDGPVLLEIYDQARPNEPIAKMDQPATMFDDSRMLQRFIWAGGNPVARNYYAKITNYSTQSISYCLVYDYVDKWICN